MSGDAQRIDKWLWHARIARTRTLSAALVTGGHVRLNRVRVTKPGHTVRAGDVVTVGLRGRVLVLRIEALAERRGSAEAARALYTDLSPPPLPREPGDGARAAGAGRPTKRDRRSIMQWKQGFPRTDESGE